MHHCRLFTRENGEVGLSSAGGKKKEALKTGYWKKEGRKKGGFFTSMGKGGNRDVFRCFGSSLSWPQIDSLGSRGAKKLPTVSQMGRHRLHAHFPRKKKTFENLKLQGLIGSAFFRYTLCLTGQEWRLVMYVHLLPAHWVIKALICDFPPFSPRAKQKEEKWKKPFYCQSGIQHLSLMAP